MRQARPTQAGWSTWSSSAAAMLGRVTAGCLGRQPWSKAVPETGEPDERGQTQSQSLAKVSTLPANRLSRLHHACIMLASLVYHDLITTRILSLFHCAFVTALWCFPAPAPCSIMTTLPQNQRGKQWQAVPKAHPRLVSGEQQTVFLLSSCRGLLLKNFQENCVTACATTPA